MGLITEVWARPGSATPGRVIDGLPYRYQTLHDTFNAVGDGSIQVPTSFDRFDEILDINENSPASSVSSLIRVFSEADPTTPIFEWLPSSIVPTEAKDDPNVDIGGNDIKSIIGYARVEAYDWDGSDDWVPTVADWIYGGDNILSNPSFEDPQAVPTIYQLTITATGGTFTLSDSTSTTSAIAFNATPGTIETRIQTDLPDFPDVIVVGVQASPYAVQIEMVTPPFSTSPPIAILVLDPSSLTGGTASLIAVQSGHYTTGPWTEARALFSGGQLVGRYDQPITPSDDHAVTGTFSMKVDPGQIFGPSNRQAGIQQVVSVIPGQTYQASIWIYPTNASDTYQLQIRTLGSERIAQTATASFTANTWSQMTLPDVVIPDGVTQVVFRVSNMNEAVYNPSTFYLDDAEFREGQQATTVGAIMGDLYDDATTDHASRLVWEDLANPGTPYLTLDFDDALDSAGVAWVETEVEAKLWMRMSYIDVLDHFARTYDIEWRVVPDNVEAGTWLLQIYNPGGMSTDYSAAATPAIQGGASDVRRSIRRFLPSATNHLVEGLARVTARADTVGLEAAIGRIEGQRLDNQLTVQTAVADAAAEDADDTTANAAPYSYELVNPQDEPLVAYRVGDVLTVHDPPDVDDVARLLDVEVVDTPYETTYDVQFYSTGGSP